VDVGGWWNQVGSFTTWKEFGRHAMVGTSEENGRMAEVAARKQTESEFQNFQTRKYESGWAADELINP